MLRLIIGGVFIYAGMTKMREPLAFADNIATFQILPKELINLFALGLPPFEIITGSMLVIGWQKRAAAFSIMILTGFFILALGQALARGLNVDCGCFGSGKPSVWKTWMGLGRDAVLLMAAWWIYTAFSPRTMVDGQREVSHGAHEVAE